MSETTTTTTTASAPSLGCPECAGPIRRTVDLVCPSCGKDYAAAATLPGLELVAPGIARQVQLAHDLQVASLEALLAESRQDADRAAEVVAGARLRLEIAQAELAAAQTVVAAARDLVSWWDRTGSTPPRGTALTHAVRDLKAGGR
jgi:hypothetical protein